MSGRWRAMSSVTPSWISRNLAASGSRALVRITPHSTRLTRIAPSPLTTPYPVCAVPGSMPRTITASRLPRHVGHADVEVRPDLLHIVELLEGLDELEHRFGVLARDGDGVLRDHRQLGLGDLEALALERAAHGVERRGVGRDDVLT